MPGARPTFLHISAEAAGSAQPVEGGCSSESELFLKRESLRTVTAETIVPVVTERVVRSDLTGSASSVVAHRATSMVTRRFCERPAAVELSATGFWLP
jgi:hypothetical protein